MEHQQLKHIIEALLMTTQMPISVDKILEVFEDDEKPSRQDIEMGLALLDEEYQDRSFELKNLGGGYILKTKQAFSPWVSRHQADKPNKYSRALLETLAIIAYKQPVTRGDIEDIRGVAVSSQIMKTLLERGWIKSTGHRDVPGKPAVYITTKAFLDYFNLMNLSDLPPLMDIESMAGMPDELLEQVQETNEQ